MVLIGGEHGDGDQGEPDVEDHAAGLPEMGGVAYPEDHQQGDVQRGGLIERFIEDRQRREQGAEEAVRHRPGEAEAQREGEEAGHAEELRREQPPAMYRKLPPGRADERRHGVEEVDRPVGEDRPGEEWDVALPIEGDRADAGAAAAQPVGEAVAGEEEGTEEGEPERRRLPWSRLGRLAQPSTPPASRSARETEKIPQRSIFCPSLRKPAADTSSSISPCVRRRMIHGWPSRWEASTRAMNSSCGCQGWLVYRR